MQTVLKYDNVIACTNVMAIVENLRTSSRINYVYMASSQSKFTLPNLPIAVKILCSLCKSKKYLITAFIKINSSC